VYGALSALAVCTLPLDRLILPNHKARQLLIKALTIKAKFHD
jgi:hypothetical protein